MESHDTKTGFGPVVHTTRASEAPSVIVVCEHASNRVPEFLGDMGLSADALQSHIAWDPGALPVAQGIADQMSAALVYGGVSRLVYDCNRPPEAADAMPVASEDVVIPANKEMTGAGRAERIAQVYEPFRDTLFKEIANNSASLKLMVTVHSFTPVYRGQNRDVELGLLHGQDARFARAMLAHAPTDLPFVTRLNEPYSAADGVAHTLDAHAQPRGLLNVMIEIRNDLLRTAEDQQGMVDTLVPWLQRTLDAIQVEDGA